MEKKLEQAAAEVRERHIGYKVPKKALPPKVNKPPTPDPYTTSSPPFYAKVRTLQKGDVFGLENLRMQMLQAFPWGHNSSRLALVSIGAEVIALNKQFFCTHADIRVQQDVLLHNTFNHPPSHFYMQQSRKLQLAWDLYKTKLADMVIQDRTQGRKHHGVYFSQPKPVDPKALLGLAVDRR